MIYDKRAGKEYLKKVQQMQQDRRKRKLQAMIDSSLDPTRKLVDFRRENIDVLFETSKEKKIEQK